MPRRSPPGGCWCAQPSRWTLPEQWSLPQWPSWCKDGSHASSHQRIPWRETRSANVGEQNRQNSSGTLALSLITKTQRESRVVSVHLALLLESHVNALRHYMATQYVTTERAGCAAHSTRQYANESALYILFIYVFLLYFCWGYLRLEIFVGQGRPQDRK